MLSTKFTVSIRDINYGNHLDHLKLIGFLHEARVQLIRSMGFNELDVDGHGAHLVVVELECKYKKESFYGDVLMVLIKPYYISRFKFGFEYTVTNSCNTIALAKISVAFVKNKPVLVPKHFLALLNK